MSLRKRVVGMNLLLKLTPSEVMRELALGNTAYKSGLVIHATGYLAGTKSAVLETMGHIQITSTIGSLK